MFEDIFIRAEDYLAALERRAEEERQMRGTGLAARLEYWFEDHPCLFALSLYTPLGLFFSTLTLLAALL